jgi:hypothetical protein
MKICPLADLLILFLWVFHKSTMSAMILAALLGLNDPRLGNVSLEEAVYFSPAKCTASCNWACRGGDQETASWEL